MKKLILISLLLMLSGLLGGLAFGQANVPPCDPNHQAPNCTDYFGVANWANSPLPAGAITGFTVMSAGSGYVNPVFVITDISAGSGAVAPTFTLNATGGIATVTGTGGGTEYTAPQVSVVDVGSGGTLALPTCGGVNQPACGSGAVVTATLGAPMVSGSGMRKFVDTLTLPLANLSLAAPDTTTFPGADYYVIELREYSTKLHMDLPPTRLRGYVQTNTGTPSALNATGAPPPISYLGPTILASKDRPVRVLFKNMLPIGSGGNLFIPVDSTYMGAGLSMAGPLSAYSQNRATLHLHGGATPWISDGTPHQWTSPAGETGPARGDSVQFVPDMWFDANGALLPACAGQPTCATVGATNDPGPGALTFFWTNQQGGRLMFYHDHAYGLTRLNVYAGEAAGFLLLDPAEESLLAAATVPGTISATTLDVAHLVPLVIQDKTFVPNAAQLAAEDPTWTAGGFGTTPGTANPGDLWFPHVYTPNQNPADVGGSNAFGRWDYGPWTLPGNQTVLLAATPTVGDVTIPCTSTAFPNQAVNCPIIPNPSGTPEGFLDTPLVNGKAYPTLHVAPAAYRFQILSAANDRSFNLQLYVADPTVLTPDGRINTEVKMVPAVQPGAGATLPLCSQLTPITNTSLFMGLATAILDGSGNPINNTGLPAACWPNFGAGSQTAGIPIQQTMWAADGRAGGVPDPTTAGPPFIQIGTEGGLLPAAVVIPSMPTGYEANPRSVTITNVSVHGLWLGTAERADAIVDFTNFAGKTLILYNDAPTPAPAGDSRLDYYTGDLDQTPIGGAPSTLPGFGPNTRTLMQIVVDGTAPNAVPFNLTALQAALPNIFAQTQPPIIVPEPTYPQASGGYSAIPTYSLITDATLTFFPNGSITPITYTDERKTIQELFTLDYGRMNATLGVELPLTNFLTQTTIPLGYIDPPTEIIKDGDTQLWHITHNGVDTHFIHFHLFNVQVINRSAWDGTKRPPDQNELGWKDTVRMNPLEDILVALKPIQPLPPFPVRDSYRLMDVTQPVGSDCPAVTAPGTATPPACSIFTNVDPKTNVGTQTPNAIVNFGWEYVWHCHILGHEENDMMRAIAFNVPPEAPSSLTVAPLSTGLSLSWIDNSASETGFTLQRDATAAFLSPTSISVPASLPKDAYGQGISWGSTLTYSDPSATGAGPYFYRVMAFKPEAIYWGPAGNLNSAWSNTATLGSSTGISPAALAFGTVALNATSPSQTVTISNSGTLPLTFTSVTFSVPNTFTTPTNVCPNPLPANSNCTLTVAFTPTVVGPVTATLNIGTTDTGNPTLTVSLTGTGAGIGISPAALAFGTVALNATSPSQTVTISNSGTLPLTFTSLGFSLPNFSTPTNVCPNPLSANSNCTLTVAFTPTVVGPVNATLTVGTSDPATPTLTVSLAGTGGSTLPLLTITALNTTMRYGSKVPIITATFSPANPVGLTALPICTTTATSTNATPVGTYPTTCSGAAGPYTFTYVQGTASITPAPLTIWANSASMMAGSTVPIITPSYVGLVGGDTATSPTAPICLPWQVVPVPPAPGTPVTTGSPVGTYTTVCSGAVDPNYTISYVNSTIAVTKGALTITAPSATMTYGGPIPASASLAPTYDVNPPALPFTAPVCTTSATLTTAVGTYAGGVTCSGAVDPNYTITYVAGTLTVTQAPLVITAPSPTMTYGGPVPTLTPSYATFVGGDTAASLTTPPTCTTAPAVTVTSPVGIYPVTCTGAVDPNYSITYVAGTLTVNAAPLTITANNASKTYGQTTTFLGTEFAAAGLLNGDTATSVTLTSAGAAATAAAGSYAIVPSAAVGTGLTNYLITYTNGTLTVNGAPLTITANNASKTYGQAATFAATAFTSSGLLNGDTITGVTLTSTGAVATAAVGPYAIVPSAAVGTGIGSYTITYLPGTLTVGPAPLTITANNASKIYGQTAAFLGTAFTATGLLNSDTVSGVTLASTGAAATAVVGPYPITPSAAIGIGLTNYTIAYANGTLTVGQATTATTITSNLPSPAIIGQIVTVTFSVAPQFAGAPTGTVTVRASTGESCIGTLAAGRGSCALTFAIGGPRTLTASYPGDLNFLGGSSAPATQMVSSLSLSTSSLLFGNQLVGTVSAPQTVTLSNVGSTSITIIGVQWSANFSDSNNCGASLLPGRSCRINVRFAPTATGVLTGTLTITDSDATSPQVVSLTGTGIAPVNTLSPAAGSILTFNSAINVTSASQPVTVTNTGTAPLFITSISRNGANANQFAQTNNCPISPASLGANGSCTINVTFTPTAASPLTKTAALNVNVSAPALSGTINLTGNLMVPSYTLSPLNDFGTVARGTSSAPQTLTLTNGPNAPLTVNAIALGGTNPGQFTLPSNTCGPFPNTLAANATCTVNVTFTPTSAGAKSATLTVRVAAPATNQSVPLTGTGN
ncbi:MAG: MBG domain-containing protein [Candidatus Acidiferrum sp.]